MMNINIQIERIISELRRGEKVVIHDNLSQISVLLSAAEVIQNNTLNEHVNLASSFPSIILSSTRCNALGIKTDTNCSYLIDSDWSKDDILNLALSKNVSSNFKIEGLIEENNKIVSACLNLLKKSKLVPTGIMTLISNVDDNNILDWSNENDLLYLSINNIETKDNDNFNDFQIITKAHLPIQQTDDCDIIVFRSNNGINEYFCLLFGLARELPKKQINYIPTIRIHSQCVTGDILNSLKCDCGDQLKNSIDLMVKNKEGILIYLSQEGRNIGLTNKLRAYKLQEEGLDTIDANLMLGFEEDERSYEIAYHILKTLNVNSIKLITNNPNKIKELEKMGIKMIERISVPTKSNPYNKNYLNTKKIKTGHYI